MKFDYHTHHKRCGHAAGAIEDYIREAMQRGLHIIGISDHSPFFADDVDHANPRIAMAKSEFPRYVKEVLRLKEKYADQIEVALGVESDFYPEHIELYRTIYDQYPFDYIIGSVHSINRVGVFNRERWQGISEQQQIAIKEQYYEYIQQSVKSGVFQVIGHMDAMKSYFPAFSNLKTNFVERTLQLIAEHRIAFEINTSYKVKKKKWHADLHEEFATDTDWYPSDEMLEKALFYGVNVTFGSDSHEQDRVADDFEKVRERLMSIGFRNWTIFRQKQAILVPM